jgi:peptidoglycan/xylan/chitin deacetylase (PgdA/CDA1 family)
MRAVLMLHSVDSSGSAISLAAPELRGLLDLIRSSGHSIVSLRELLETSAPDTVALTFDDGMASLAAEAAPMLSAEGVSATLFLTTGYVGRDNHWPSQPPSAPRLPMLDWGQVESLQAAGWAIEAHSLTHPDLRTLSDDELAEQLEAPRREIGQRLGRAPSAFAYPYGLLDQRVVDAVAQHYATALTTRMATLPAQVDPLRVPRLDSYYLRHPALQRLAGALGGFGGSPLGGWLAARGALRRWRAHPGESG